MDKLFIEYLFRTISKAAEEIGGQEFWSPLSEGTAASLS